jgi:hypothetical protein
VLGQGRGLVDRIATKGIKTRVMAMTKEERGRGIKPETVVGQRPFSLHLSVPLKLGRV